MTCASMFKRRAVPGTISSVERAAGPFIVVRTRKQTRRPVNDVRTRRCTPFRP